MERVKQFYQVTLLDEEYTLTADDFHKFQKECSEIAAFKNHGATGCTHCQHQDQDTTEFDHVADEPDQLIELDLAQGGYCNEWIRRPPSMQELLEMKEKPEILVELHQDGLTIDGREYLLTKSPHKAIKAEAQQGQILSLDVDAIVDKMVAPIDKARNQIDVMVVKDKVETMEAPKKSGRPSKIAKDLKPLKKDAAVPPLDPEMDQIRKLAADKYGLAWTDAKRIWCLGSDLTKQEVTAVLPWVYPDTVWGFYRECHKGVEA